MDQAAGLRDWLASAGREVRKSPLYGDLAAEGSGAGEDVTVCAPKHILMAVGAPGSEQEQVEHIRRWLTSWQRHGSSWVGDVESWAIIPVTADSTQLAALAARAVRWGIWIEDGPSAFRRTFSLLTRLAESGGPTRLLALHAPGIRRAGLLQNLQQAAHAYLGIELLVLAR